MHHWTNEGSKSSPLSSNEKARSHCEALIKKEIAEVVKHPDVIKSFNVAAVEPVGSGPEEAGKALQREVDAMARSAKFAQLKPE